VSSHVLDLRALYSCRSSRSNSTSGAGKKRPAGPGGGTERCSQHGSAWRFPSPRGEELRITVLNGKAGRRPWRSSIAVAASYVESGQVCRAFGTKRGPHRMAAV